MTERVLLAITCILYIVFLYSGSGLLRQLSSSFRQLCGDNLNIIVSAGLLAILGILLLRRRKTVQRHGLVPIFFLLCGYALAFWYLQVPEERLHLLQYGLLTYLFSRMLGNRLKGLAKYSLVICLVTLIGIGDEILQSLQPDRVGDVRDVLINCLAALLAQGLLVVTGTADIADSFHT